MWQWAKVAKINIQGNVGLRLRILIKEIGHRQFHSVVVGTIDGRSEEGGKRRNRHFRYAIILSKGIEEGVLELCCIDELGSGIGR